MTASASHVDIHDHIEQLVEHHTHREFTWVKCWVCPDRCPVGDCQRDTRDGAS